MEYLSETNRISSLEQEARLNVYRDIKNSIDTSYEEGEAKGKIEGKNEEKRQTATLMLEENEPIDKIMKFTGLSRDEIDKLKR